MPGLRDPSGRAERGDRTRIEFDTQRKRVGVSSVSRSRLQASPSRGGEGVLRRKAGRANDQPGQAPQKLQRGEEAMGVTVLARLAERERDAPIARLLQLLVGEGRPQSVSKEAPSTLAIATFDSEVRVDVHAVHVDEQRAEALHGG